MRSSDHSLFRTFCAAPRIRASTVRAAGICALLFACFAAAPHAHAILVQSSPAIHGVVAGPNVEIHLRFNVRVDVPRSRFSLVYPDATVHTLVPEKQTSPDTVAAEASGLATGAYTIRWQVLAADGHISRGEIPFKVGH